MAGVLYTYSVTSIRAAKRNAQLHREADGGQLDMRRESLRRHGVLDKVEGTTGIQLFRDSAKDGSSKETATNNSKLKGSSSGRGEAKGQRTDPDVAVGGSGGNKAMVYGEMEKREAGQSSLLGKGGFDRTEAESQLQEYKGRGKLRELGTKVVPPE